MNSQVETRFRDGDDARRKLVSFTSGVGFRHLVKQALAPGEPLQIDIGDGNVLVLERHRLPVESGYSFGVGSPSEKAPAQDASGQRGRPQRRGLVLGGIAAAVGLSALGILWGGMRGVGQAWAPPAASEWQAATTVRVETTKRSAEIKATNSVEPPAIVTSEPEPAAHSRLTASLFPDRKLADGASIPASSSEAPPVRPVSGVNAPALKTVSDKISDPNHGILPATSHAEVVVASNSPASSVADSAHSISIKASRASWVRACADGVRVFAKLFNAGDVREVRFSREATLRSGNAAALELLVGKQTIGPRVTWGQFRTIKVTPAGYEFATAAPASTCSETSPEN